MEFMIKYWLYFGAGSILWAITLLINFIVMTRKSLDLTMTREEAKDSLIRHFCFGFCCLFCAIPFLIGAVVQIIKYVNAN